MTSSKNLVYFVIGGPNKDYIQLLKYAINTLRCYNEYIDIMVMCEKSYISEISQLPVILHVTADNETHIHASMRKVEIFDFLKDKTHYENVLYLDCDIMIHGSLKPLFDKMTKDNVLYGVPENKNTDDHKLAFFQCLDQPYSQETLDFFKQNNIYVLNAGQFAFKNSPIMKQHFTNVLAAINSRYTITRHFYEQSFINDYFNTKNIVCYDIAECCSLNRVEHLSSLNIEKISIVNHFYNAAVPSLGKLGFMKSLHTQCIEKKKPVHIDTRQHIGSIIPKKDVNVIAEIGTFRGEYAKKLFQTFQPTKMYLIDPLSPDKQMESGDQDGNYVKTYNGSQLYDAVVESFKQFEQEISESPKSRIQLIRAFSTDITQTKQIPDKSLDLIYIDGDHSYEGVTHDLKLAFKLVKSGGWICGHDYEMNKSKAHHNYDFGVKKAVDEFCAEHGFCIWAKMMDGCVSYVLRRF